MNIIMLITIHSQTGQSSFIDRYTHPMESWPSEKNNIRLHGHKGRTHDFKQVLCTKTLCESVDRKGRIRLRITRQELHSKYSYAKIKNLLIAIEGVPERHINLDPLYDRLHALRYGTTRNRLAAGVAFITAILFLLS
jgi:hypothetical protein